MNTIKFYKRLGGGAVRLVRVKVTQRLRHICGYLPVGQIGKPSMRQACMAMRERGFTRIPPKRFERLTT